MTYTTNTASEIVFLRAGEGFYFNSRPILTNCKRLISVEQILMRWRALGCGGKWEMCRAERVEKSKSQTY